jgi:hypothetical protein
MDTALLPEELIDSDPRLVSDLKVGETGYLDFVNFIVKADRTCFVELEGKLRQAPGTMTVTVTKLEDGSFSAIVPANTKYRPGKITPLPGNKLAPVTSIAIGPLTR